MPWPFGRNSDWKKFTRRAGIPFLLIYLLQLTCPKEEHFMRYVEERKKYEPEFCIRIDHPSCRIYFENHFIYCKATIDSCGFRQRNSSPFGNDTGTSRWTYYGIINNWFHEKRQF